MIEKKNSRPLNFKKVNPKAAYAAKSSGKIVAGIVTAIEDMKLVANLFSVRTVVYELKSQFCEKGLKSTSHQPEVCASPFARNEVINNPTVGSNHRAAKTTNTMKEPRPCFFCLVWFIAPPQTFGSDELGKTSPE